jgi:hypothetical protein
MANTPDTSENTGCLLLVVLLAGLIFLGNLLYHLDRDLDSVMDRAQVAADAGDMLDYVRTLSANMRANKATTGNTALVFKTPRTELALQFQTVQRIVERLDPFTVAEQG